MELKRCARCGSFFASDADVCGACNKKDNADVLKLKNFLEEKDEFQDKEQLAMFTGISIKNINRYLNMEEFSNIIFLDAVNDVQTKSRKNIIEKV